MGFSLLILMYEHVIAAQGFICSTQILVVKRIWALDNSSAQSPGSRSKVNHHDTGRDNPSPISSLFAWLVRSYFHGPLMVVWN